MVEDEPNLREALCQILENRGFESDGVNDGKKGLHAAMSGLFDVVILDVMLPKLDGFEVLKKMRRSDILTPVIITTALGASENIEKGLSLGANAYVTKPFNVDELVSKIRTVAGLSAQNVMQLGDISLNLADFTVTIGEKKASLSENEVILLECFMNNETNIVPFEELTKKIVVENLDDYISILTRKLSYLNADIDILHIKGLGYKLMMGDAPQIEWEKGF